MRSVIIKALSVAVVAMGTSLPVKAADIMLNAVSYADIPDKKSVAIELFNDSPRNLDLKAQFEEQLRQAGYTIDQSAQLIFSFDTRDTSGKWTGGGSSGLISLENSDNHTGTDAPRVRVSIFDTQKGGILNEGSERGITEVAPSQIRVEVTLEDRTNGRRLWEAWTVSNIGASDDPSVPKSMVGPLVQNIGKTVRDETIPSR